MLRIQKGEAIGGERYHVLPVYFREQLRDIVLKPLSEAEVGMYSVPRELRGRTNPFELLHKFTFGNIAGRSAPPFPFQPGMVPQMPPFQPGMVLSYMQDWVGSLLSLLAAFMPQPQYVGPNAHVGAGSFASFPQSDPAGQAQPHNPGQESGAAGVNGFNWQNPWGFYW